ncbi:putative 11.2 kDa protein in IE1-IEN intergenic region [Orchesella cincta]|uniref:Putative 11.2 kDa protein in IE1-IEN intergenic region n=1 Tax=Orchesella cincta TaxID=48709 RepID=A0A1D2N6B1_ORCCI|nr:putative 11.2 kDa protein in IE1-IEN intergenic region [Orchesella cincta]
MAGKILLCIYLFLKILPDSALGGIVTVMEPNATEQIDPCPCLDQPEGVMMPHPVDCRAYYICVGASSVHYSRCGAGDQFFHPYLRTCVQRSKYLFFVPNIVDTKDLCKINSVFRTPAAENFDNCHIESDGDITPTSNSIEELHPNSVNDLFTSAPIMENVGLPWFTNTSTTKALNNSIPQSMNFTTGQLPELSLAAILSTTTTTTEAPTTKTTSAPPIDCKISKVLVYHFPGPCKAEITCESGASFTVNQCLNTLTFISQFTPSSTSN